MSILIAAMLLAAPQTTPADAAPAAQKKKPQQICEMIEVTGSRARKRVCRDASGQLDLGPGVSDSAFGKARIERGPGGSAPTAPGGSI
jgi:hypothetical protein